MVAGSPASSLRLAVVYADYRTHASYFDDWLDAFSASPLFDCQPCNIVTKEGRHRLTSEVTEAEAVVILHSVLGDSLAYAQDCLGILQNRRGPLLSFVGNEVNLPGAPIADKIAFLKAVNAQVIATQLLEEAGRYLYEGTGAKVVSIPHALNVSAFRPLVPQAERQIDIGVRTFRYYPHLGDNSRNRLVDWFVAEAPKRGLMVDISTTERLNREGWSRLLNASKGTIANEAGSWWLQRDDAIVDRIVTWQKSSVRGPVLYISTSSPLRRVAHRLPWEMRQHLSRWLRRGFLRYEAFVAEDIIFDEIFDLFFRNQPRAPVYSKCISSRNFDAIGAKCAQIMFPGRYNDILTPDMHFIELAEDFSNVDDVLRRFADLEYRRSIVDTAYNHIMSAHTYSHRIQLVYRALTTHSPIQELCSNLG